MALERLLGTANLATINSPDAIAGTSRQLGWNFKTSAAGKVVSQGWVRMNAAGTFVAGTKWQLWKRATPISASTLIQNIEIGSGIVTGASGSEQPVPGVAATPLVQNDFYFVTIFHPNTQPGDYWFLAGFGNPVSGSLSGNCIFRNGGLVTQPPDDESFVNGGFGVDIGIDDATTVLTAQPAAGDSQGNAATFTAGIVLSAQAGGGNPAGPAALAVTGLLINAAAGGGAGPAAATALVTTDLVAGSPGGAAPAGGTASFTGLQRPPLSFTVVQELGECVAAALAETTAGPPERQCLVVPGQIAWDQCQCGQLALTVNRFYWARDATLAQTSDFGGASDCGLPYLVMDVTISILRCAPVGDIKKQLAPSCQELLDAARIWHEDAQAVRVGAGCCLKTMENDLDILAFALREQRAVGPEGGCVGSELGVLIALPNCLCPA